MKRIVFWCFIFIQLCICFLPLECIYANAETKDKLNESIYELIGEMDMTALEEYVKGLTGFSDEGIAERLIAYIEGENVNYKDFFTQLLEVLLKKAKELLPAFAVIIAITLLSGILSTLKSGSNSKTTSDMIFLISYAAALIPLIAVLTECFSQTLYSISEMQKQMQIIFPLMLTLMAASGGISSVAICRPAVAFFSSVIVSLISTVIVPLSITIITFSMAGNLTKELKLSKFTVFFKSINKWIIGVSISIFGLFFSLQGITSSTYDGIVRRAAKYAIGNGIPIVGGFLSGGFDLAVAGSILIKNALGSMSIFLIVSVLFEPAILLICVNMLLRFTAAVTQPLGDSRISDFLGETADNLHYCSAGLLFTAFLYFVCIVVLVSASEALL